MHNGNISDSIRSIKRIISIRLHDELSIISSAFFGNKEFGAIVLEEVQIFFAVGFAAGSSVFGLLVDNMGYAVFCGLYLHS